MIDIQVDVPQDPASGLLFQRSRDLGNNWLRITCYSLAEHVRLGQPIRERLMRSSSTSASTLTLLAVTNFRFGLNHPKAIYNGFRLDRRVTEPWVIEKSGPL